MGASKFLRSWMAVDALKISSASRENLERTFLENPKESATFNRESLTWSKVGLRLSVVGRLSQGGSTYNEEYAILCNSAFRAKTSCGSERPLPGWACVSMMVRAGKEIWFVPA